MITDLYITATTLRLRRVATGSSVVYKLGQKLRVDEASPETVRLTNIYLSADEYLVMSRLPAAEVRKTRHYLEQGGLQVSIDRFYGHLEGLVLAELELAANQEWRPSPLGALADVTTDDRFSDGTLALTSAADLASLLASFR